MKFPYDPDKRAATLKKHGFDLRDFREIFDRPWVYDKKVDVVDGEKRRGIIGYLGDELVVGVYTKRKTSWRVITIYKANKERRKYYETESAGSSGKRSKKRAKKRREEKLASARKGPKNVRKNR